MGHYVAVLVHGRQIFRGYVFALDPSMGRNGDFFGGGNDDAANHVCSIMGS